MNDETQSDEVERRDNDEPGKTGDLSPEEQLDLEKKQQDEDPNQRLKDQRAEYVVEDSDARDYRVEGQDVRDYIGVDPEYMTYASHTHAPMLTDTERLLHTTQYDHLLDNADDETGEYLNEIAPQVAVVEAEVPDDAVLGRDFEDENNDGRDDKTGLSREAFDIKKRAAEDRQEADKNVVTPDGDDEAEAPADSEKKEESSPHVFPPLAQ